MRGVMERIRWHRLSVRFSGDSFCACVCVCVVTHHSHSHPTPLHVSLFIPQSFGHLTKTNDSASEMSRSSLHKQVEQGRGRDGEKAMQSRPVLLFSVWLCPLA